MDICVFGSSSEQIDRIYLDSAVHLGKSLAKKGHGVIYGAGKYGIMGAVARGAASENGKLVGVTPRFFDELEVISDICTELIYTETMRERKAIMEDRADAFIICAGGMGTFEEFFEVLTLKQLNRHSKAIIVYNLNGYYDPMIAMMENAVQEKFMSGDCSRLFSVARSEDEVFEQLESYVPFSYNKYDFLDWSKEEQNG
ncbi:MAG: TIGR00730 family Rossman fold protein [Clostridiales bacterium]|nr:TIGR00730 family Rossman fold protein [Clostridiales bacterium]